MVADSPDQKISLKMFHSEIQNDTKKMSEELKEFKRIPKVFSVTSIKIMDNYFQVKLDVKTLLEMEVKKLIAKKGL